MSMAPLELDSVLKAWGSFFHATIDRLAYDQFRRGYAILLLVYCLQLWPNAVFWFGESGGVPYTLSLTLRGTDCWSLFDLLPATDASAYLVLAGATASSVLLLFGLCTRLASLCCFVLLVSLQNRNPMFLDSEDALFRVFGFLMIAVTWIAPGSGRSPQAVPIWPLRLIQLQMCIIFLGCAWSKLLSDDWIEGRAMYYTTRLHDLWGRIPLPNTLLESNNAMAWLGWLVMVIEFAVPLTIWWKRLRLPALLTAVSFHVAVEATMNLFLFHWIMLLGWSAFLEDHERRRLAQ